ncbi:hypothetical protein GH714_023096 [Hevea brasiliensis]|uniref:Pentacotripeptide-repeat region of PRORP domain-containing protein n=1 Tax=Hevea brasiliensis TaxID=3981 RepID=A0A6A6MVD6_HEVBR|nr:hypothetical protein GH714_023096 [Hevea brasiliensis]
MIAGGYQSNVYTYTVIVNALCKCGKTDVVVGLLKEMVERGCEPDVVTYSAIIDALCKDKLVIEALDLFSRMRNKGFLKHKDVSKATQLIDEMVDKGFSAHATTFELVIHLSPNDDLIVRKLRNRSKCSKGPVKILFFFIIETSSAWDNIFKENLKALLVESFLLGLAVPGMEAN